MTSVILDNAADMCRELFDDITNKHQDGEFLPELATNPHNHKEVNALLLCYCELLSELGEVFVLNRKCRISAAKKLKEVAFKLKENRRKEKTLFWKTFNLEIGGDH